LNAVAIQLTDAAGAWLRSPDVGALARALREILARLENHSAEGEGEGGFCGTGREAGPGTPKNLHPVRGAA